MRLRRAAGATSLGRVASTARCALALAWLTAVLVLAPTAPAAAALQPIDLRVEGGEQSWHPERVFSLHWSNPPGVASVHYRLLDPDGEVARAEQTSVWPLNEIRSLEVRGEAGVYSAEVWLQDGDGATGEPVLVRLRFDDGVPSPIEPAPAAGWIGRTAFPYTAQLSHPVDPTPLSGIRGYAVSLDREPDGHPCSTEVCAEDEIDLRGGASDDRVAIGELPEGAWYLHAVAVSGAGIASASAGTTLLRVDKTDPAVRLEGVPGGWSRDPVTVTVTASDSEAGMAPVGGGPTPFTAIAVEGAPPVLAPGDRVELTLIGSGAHAVAYYARDAAGNVADGGMTNGLPNRDPATAIVRIDREPPRVAFAGSQDPRDPELIEARATDRLSGIDPGRGSIGVRPAGSAARFTELPTERRGGTLAARWDSESVPPGEYEFRAIAFDVAGNPTSTALLTNGAPMRLNAPLKPLPRVLARLRGPVGRLDRSARLTGRLVIGRHASLAGLSVRVLERFDPGAVPPQRVSFATTDAQGRYSAQLEGGPGREVLVQSPSTPTLRPATSQPLQIAVPARVRLRVSSTRARVGGHPIVFSGRVRATGARIPSDGKVVALQFRLPGLPWRAFRTVRTNKRGRFRYAYRFADDDSRGAHFQFRAVAVAEENWPYLQAHSSKVIVTGV